MYIGHKIYRLPMVALAWSVGSTRIRNALIMERVSVEAHLGFGRCCSCLHRITGPKQQGSEHWPNGLVSPMLTQDVGGIGSSRDVIESQHA